MVNPTQKMTELIAALAAKADATVIALIVVILALLAMLREKDRILVSALDRLSAVITELRIDLPKGRGK